MSTKTFESAVHSGKTMTVHTVDCGDIVMRINLKESEWRDIALDHADIPALALAVLEAAGFTEESTNFGTAVHELGLAIKEQERATAEAREQAKLEALALKLFNASRLERGLDELDWVLVTPSERAEWLAVARRARELAQEGK